MPNPLREIERFRVEIEALRRIPFDDRVVLSLLRRLLKSFETYLPKAGIEQRRNKWVCNFGLRDVPLIMIEPVHGRRGAIPLRWRHQMLDVVEEILDRIELMMESFR